jgi:hypothetical protein
MKRTLRAAAAVAVSLGLIAVAPAGGLLPEAGITSIGSTGCCKS